MNDLTNNEKKVLNNLTNQRDKGVSLGDILQRMISEKCVSGTPVSKSNAFRRFGFSGVVKDGETITLNNPAVSGSDVYEFVADTAKSKTVASNIAVDINAKTVKATGSLTMDTKPTAGDTVTIGDKTYIFVPTGTANAPGEVAVGAALANSQAALVAAINGTDGLNTAHPSVRAAAFAANVSAITALIGGTAGNAIATTETFTAGTNVFAAATLGTGADCSAADASAALIAAITASDTQGVGAVDATGDIVLIAKVGGASGNAITIYGTAVNLNLGDNTHELSGGIDGTVGSAFSFMCDGDYLYFSLAESTISTSNWVRFTFDSEF